MTNIMDKNNRENDVCVISLQIGFPFHCLVRNWARTGWFADLIRLNLLLVSNVMKGEQDRAWLGLFLLYSINCGTMLPFTLLPHGTSKYGKCLDGETGHVFETDPLLQVSLCLWILQYHRIFQSDFQKLLNFHAAPRYNKYSIRTKAPHI